MGYGGGELAATGAGTMTDLALALFPLAQRPDRPVPLVTLEESRRGIRTAEIRWSMTHNGRTERFAGRLAVNGDVIVEMLSESQRVVFRDELGAPPPQPVRYLFKGARRATYRYGDTPGAGYYADRSSTSYTPDLRDWRRLGLDDGFPYRPPSPMTPIGEALSKPCTETPGDALMRYDGRDERPQSTVTATFSSCVSREWLLNQEKGWQAERIITRSADGEVVTAARFSHQKFGETWFPAAGQFRRATGVHDSYDVKSVAVEHLVANEPGSRRANSRLPTSGLKSGCRSWLRRPVPPASGKSPQTRSRRGLGSQFDAHRASRHA
jgi:hypothetical protein